MNKKIFDIDKEIQKMGFIAVDPRLIYKFACNHCDKRYAYNRNLIQHIKIKHPEFVPKKVDKAFKCQHCPKSYGFQNNLRVHINEKHKSVSPPKKKITLNCKEFDSVADFIDWKYDLEDTTLSRFVFRNSIKCKTYITKTYLCFRNGIHKPLDVRKRISKKGTCKVGNICKARISAKFYKSGKVQANFFSKHTGHDPQNDRKFFTMRPRERNHICSLFAEGLTFTEILEKLKDVPNFENLNIQRLRNTLNSLQNSKVRETEFEPENVPSESSNLHDTTTKLDAVKDNKKKLNSSFTKCLDHQLVNETGDLPQSTPLRDLVNSPHGVYVIKIICEFLQFMGLDEVLSLLQNKVAIVENVSIDRKELAKEFNIQEDEKNKKYPFIWSLLAEKRGHGKENNPTPKKPKRPSKKSNNIDTTDYILDNDMLDDSSASNAGLNSTTQFTNDVFSYQDYNSSFQVRSNSNNSSNKKKKNLKRKKAEGGVDEECVLRHEHVSKFRGHVLEPNTTYVTAPTRGKGSSAPGKSPLQVSLVNNHNGTLVYAQEPRTSYSSSSYSSSSSIPPLTTCANQNIKRDTKKVYIIKSTSLNNNFTYEPTILSSEADITMPQFSTIPLHAAHNIQTHFISPELLEAVQSITVPQSFVEVETAISPPRKNISIFNQPKDAKLRTGQSRKTTFK